jgi:hypothetical protein
VSGGKSPAVVLPLWSVRELDLILNVALLLDFPGRGRKDAACIAKKVRRHGF